MGRPANWRTRADAWRATSRTCAATKSSDRGPCSNYAAARTSDAQVGGQGGHVRLRAVHSRLCRVCLQADVHRALTERPIRRWKGRRIPQEEHIVGKRDDGHIRVGVPHRLQDRLQGKGEEERAAGVALSDARA